LKEPSVKHFYQLSSIVARSQARAVFGCTNNALFVQPKKAMKHITGFGVVRANEKGDEAHHGADRRIIKFYLLGRLPVSCHAC